MWIICVIPDQEALNNDFFFMLIGEYLHTIDQKNRLSVPSKFRKTLGSTVVLTRGLDRCLFLYSVEQWQLLAEKLSSLPWGKADHRSFFRHMIAGATDIDIDSLGRILVPEYLKSHAHLEKDAIVVGLFNRIEIWRPDTWQEYRDGSTKEAERIAENLGDLGMY